MRELKNDNAASFAEDHGVKTIEAIEKSPEDTSASWAESHPIIALHWGEAA